MVSSWDGELIFVYLPGPRRYWPVDKNDENFRSRGRILEIVNNLDIPIIDIHNEVFVSLEDKMSLFPFGKPGHYNAKGYRLIAENISSHL